MENDVFALVDEIRARDEEIRREIDAIADRSLTDHASDLEEIRRQQIAILDKLKELAK